MSDEVQGRVEQIQQLRDGSLSPHQKNLNRLREKFNHLTKLADFTPELACAQLMDIVKEAERLRVKELKGAENMERQAAASRSKAEGFSVLSSIVYNVVNQYVAGAEKDAEEVARQEAERGEAVKADKAAKRKRKTKK